jgi:hypothetical protein
MGGSRVRAAAAAAVLAASTLAMTGTASAFTWPAPKPHPVQQQWNSSRLDFLHYCPGFTRYDPYGGQCGADSDHDGLADSYETSVLHTNPGSWDTDGDGFPDSLEVLLGMDPTTPNRFPRFWFGGDW